MKRKSFLKALGLMIPGVVVAPAVVESALEKVGRPHRRKPHAGRATASEFADLLEPKLREIWRQAYSERSPVLDLFVGEEE